MNLVRSAFLAVALVVSSGSVATAQDWDKGEAAYRAEDYETALQEWRPLAEQGHAEAQVNASKAVEIVKSSFANRFGYRVTVDAERNDGKKITI